MIPVVVEEEGIEMQQKHDDRELLVAPASHTPLLLSPSHLWQRVKEEVIANKGLVITTVVMSLCCLLLGALVWRDKFGWQAWVTLTIVYFTFLALVKGIWTTELVMMCNTSALLIFKIITPSQAIEGFSNSSVFTICVMFCIAAGIQHTGALEYACKYILREPPTVFQAQLRMMAPIAIISAFVNNTPVVAMMIPVVEQWCKNIKVAPSKLMMPLSYATIIGGTCTLVGTSTNLIVVSFLHQQMPDVHVGIFEIGKVGAPLVVVALLYVLLFSKWLLPDRVSTVMDIQKAKEYAVAARVAPDSILVGQEIRVSLRNLGGLFLVEVERADGHIITAVSPETEIHANDLLTFVGKVDDVPELWTLLRLGDIPGLLPVNHDLTALKPNLNRHLIEAVVASHSELIGKTPRECNFRSRYGAVIVSVHREGEHIRSKIGSIVLRVGDCLLLQCKSEIPHDIYSRDFLAVSEAVSLFQRKDASVWRMVLSVVVALSAILLNTFEVIDLLSASLVGTFVLIGTGCLTANVPLLVTIAGSFGMATAMENTGVAEVISDNLVSLFMSWGKVGLLFSIYFCTMLLTALLSNASSVAVMFPIAWRISQLSYKSRIYILMFAASADFSTPIGYQTNLMVWGPGGYKFLDYTRFGLPLQLFLCVASVFLTFYIFEE